MEAAMELYVDALYKHFNAALIEPEKPLALKRRLKLFSAAAKKLPELATETDEIVALVEYFRQEAIFRHDVVHGRKLNFSKSNPHFAVLARSVDRQDAAKGLATRTVDEPELRERYDKLGLASLCFIGAMFRVIEAKHPNDDTAGELGR